MATVKQTIKLQIEGGKATAAPPVGTALGPTGINLGDFVKRFNEGTKDSGGMIIPVIVSVFDDRTFDLTFKTPPTSRLLLKAAGSKKGAGKNLLQNAGSVTRAQVKEIAEQKMVDLNAGDMEQAVKIIEGTARSMGISVTQ